MLNSSPEIETTPSPDRPRVLTVTDDLANGGMERQLTLIAKALRPAWSVRVVSLEDGPYSAILREAGVEVAVVPREYRFDIRPSFALAQIIRDWRPDIVHTYGWMSTASCVLPCRLRGIPLVDASIQSGGVMTARDRVTRLVTRFADVAIANSRAGLDSYGVDSERGRVVYNGFDPDRQALCVGGSSPERPTVVVMTARMHPHKDYRCFLDAARILNAEDPGGWRFLAVGSGDGRADLLAEYADLIEAGAAAFPEAGAEVLSLVRDSRIGVLLTNPEFACEGVSNSVMEYMACALPVVATDLGGNREIVIEGETGMLVPAANVD
jgi:glycosyltransferase involved in cell wall biosynthesis